MNVWKWSEIRQEWRTLAGLTVTQEELAAAGIDIPHKKAESAKMETQHAIALLGVVILLGLLIAWRFARMASETPPTPAPLPRARVVQR